MFHTDDDNCWSKRKKKTFITKLTDNFVKKVE